MSAPVSELFWTSLDLTALLLISEAPTAFFLISDAPTAFFLMSSAATVFLPTSATALPVPSAATRAMKAMTRAGDGSLLSRLSMLTFLLWLGQFGQLLLGLRGAIRPEDIVNRNPDQGLRSTIVRRKAG